MLAGYFQYLPILFLYEHVILRVISKEELSYGPIHITSYFLSPLLHFKHFASLLPHTHIQESFSTPFSKYNYIYIYFTIAYYSFLLNIILVR